MASQLWERLRAARRFADMTQAQLAAACGITRSGYAFFESKDPNSRSRPSAEQVMAVSRLTRVPIEWLMNDAADPGDVWKIGVVSSTGLQAAPVRGPTHAGHSGTFLGHPLRRATDRPTRAEETFWRAVEYHLVQTNPEHEGCFDVEVSPPPFPMRVRYKHGKTMCCYTGNSSIDSLTFHMGRLLLYERALAQAFSKHLVVWSKDVVDYDGTLETAKNLFGVSIRQVSTAEEAAAYLISLG